MGIDIKINAYTTSAVGLVIGFLLIIYGDQADSTSIYNLGVIVIAVSFILGFLWLLPKILKELG